MKSFENRLPRRKSPYTRAFIVLAIALIGFVTLFGVESPELAPSRPQPQSSATKRACVGLAESRLLSFTEATTGACRDSDRQRACQDVLAREALPTLLNAIPGEGCARACQIHAIISELGGSNVSGVSFTAFLRAFIVTQPESSVLNVWASPWDTYELPDVAEGCAEGDQHFNPRLRAEQWRSRIRLRRLTRRDFGSWNLFRLWLYRAFGNDFRVYVSVRRLSDMLRFKLLDTHGGIYIDSDILLLRDLTSLCNSTFLYPWGSLDADNNAVVGSPKNGPFVAEFIRQAGNSPLAYHPLKWRKVAGKNIEDWPTRIPVMVFDPLWLKDSGLDSRDPAKYPFDTRKGFANKSIQPLHTREDAFPASLGYHWHGGFGSIPSEPSPGSMFAQLHNMGCTKHA